jgi:hypothetical protein
MAIITICLQTELACILFFATPNIIPASCLPKRPITRRGRIPYLKNKKPGNKDTILAAAFGPDLGAPLVKGNVIGGPSPTPWSSLLLSIITQLNR